MKNQFIVENGDELPFVLKCVIKSRKLTPFRPRNHTTKTKLKPISPCLCTPLSVGKKLKKAINENVHKQVPISKY